MSEKKILNHQELPVPVVKTTKSKRKWSRLLSSSKMKNLRKLPNQRKMPPHVELKRKGQLTTALEEGWEYVGGKHGRHAQTAADRIRLAIKKKQHAVYGLRTWFKEAGLAGVLVILAFVGGMIPGFLSMQQYRREECLLRPARPSPPEVMMWNNEQYVGTQVKILCSNSTDAPVKILMVCDTEQQWQVVVDNGCECKTDPLTLTNPKLRVWNGSHAQGIKVKYKCSSNLVSSIVMETECSLRRRWEAIGATDQKCRCEGDVPAVIVKGGYGLWMETKPREMGTLAIQKCAREADSPVSRAILCTEDAHWTVVGQASCECLEDPPPIPSKTIHITRKGSDTHAIGTEISYHCTKNENSGINVTYRCDSNRTWSLETVIVDGELPCQKSFVHLPMYTFQKAVEVCRNTYNGQLYRVQNSKDRDDLRTEIIKSDQKCDVSDYFIGAVEDVAFQWITFSGQQVSYAHLKPLWEKCYPNNTAEKCVIVTSREELRTYDCYKQACYVCEDPLCPDSPQAGNIVLKKQCYFVYDMAPNFFEVEKLCRARAQVVAVVADNVTMSYMFKNLGPAKLGKCSSAFVGLYVGSRVWHYWNSELVHISFWGENEPNSYNAKCVSVSANSQYQKWKAVDCVTHKACALCEVTEL